MRYWSNKQKKVHCYDFEPEDDTMIRDKNSTKLNFQSDLHDIFWMRSDSQKFRSNGYEQSSGNIFWIYLGNECHFIYSSKIVRNKLMEVKFSFNTYIRKKILNHF